MALGSVDELGDESVSECSKLLASVLISMRKALKMDSSKTSGWYVPKNALLIISS
jgi:hypothetical protein